MSTPGIADILLLLDSDDEQVRLQGARRLAAMGTEESVELLQVRVAADPSARVRYFVRRALKILELGDLTSSMDLGAMQAEGSGNVGRMSREQAAVAAPSGDALPGQTLPSDAFRSFDDVDVDGEGEGEPSRALTLPDLSTPQVGELQRTAHSILRPCVQRLIENLEHSDPGVASESAAALGHLRAPEAADRLLDLLRAGSSDENVPLALGEIGDARALGPLVRIFKEERRPDFRQAVAIAVASIRSPEADEFLRQALAHSDPMVQTAVVRVIGETRNVGFTDYLLDLIGTVDEYMEMAIVQTLGRIAPAHPRVIVRFTSLLKSEVNPRKLAVLVTALARTRNPQLVDTLEQYIGHRDRRVRANAVEAISGLDVSDPIKLRILLPMLRDPDNRVRANACVTLGRLGERRALDSLVTMLDASNKWHRASACYAIGALRPPDGATFLIKGLRDQDPAVRVNAAKSLRELGDPSAAKTLISAINDRNQWIRLYAIEALGNMGVRAANRRLRACLKQEASHQVLASALLAVAKTGKSRESTRILVDFLRHEDSRVRANAIEALEHISTRDSVTGIATCLRDKDNRVRANAVKAIWKFGELRVVTTLHDMLSSPRVEERRSGAYAIGEIGRIQSDLASTPGIDRLVSALRNHPAHAGS